MTAGRERLLAECRSLVDEAWASPPRFDATLARAEARLREALADAPDDALLLTGLGAVLCDRGRCAEAAAVLERAVAGGGADRHTFINLGIARLGSGLADAAAQAFAEANAHPASAHTWAAYFDPHAL